MLCYVSVRNEANLWNQVWFFLFLTSTISSLKSTEECSVELCFVWHALHETVCMESFKWKWFFVWICPFRIADECQLHETASPTQKEFVLNLLSFLELTSTIYMRVLIRLVRTQKLFLLINNRTSLTRISVELKWVSNDFCLWVVSIWG